MNQSLIGVAFYGTIVLKLKTQIQEVFSEFKNPLELLLLLVYLISQFDYILIKDSCHVRRDIKLK